MKTLEFELNGQYIKRKDSIVPVARCRNLYKAHFIFHTDEWSGVKTALFLLGEGKAKAQVLDEENECLIPWEFFDTDKESVGYVSVFCGELVTANRAAIKIMKSGYTESDASVDPTPDVYQQIIDKINSLHQGEIINGGVFGDGLGKDVE